MHHFVVLLIIIGAPVSTFFIHRYLREHPSERIKEICYCAVYIIYGLIAWFAASSRPLGDSIYSPDISMPWWIIVPGCLYLAYTLLVEGRTIWLVRNNPEFREKVLANYDSRSWLFPRSRRQIAMFYGISIIVGIVEEMFFRGYLTRYLMDAPFDLSWPAAAAVLGLIFGVGHFPQGWRTVISTGLHGLMYWFLYAWSGSILVPVILHILYDARIAYISSIVNPRS